jgi:hypothetical protein
MSVRTNLPSISIARPLTPQQIADIERLVNERILENSTVTWTEVKYNHIKERKDIMQFLVRSTGSGSAWFRLGAGRRRWMAIPWNYAVALT